MTTPPPDDPLLAHTDDAAAASLLRRQLTAIADEHRGSPMARRVRDVLTGQRDLSELERDQDFMDLMRTGVRRYEDYVASLSPEDKVRLYAEAREIADAADRHDDH